MKPSGRAASAFFVGLVLVLAINAGFVLRKDPLLFWSARATPSQPLFATTKQGNFSRFVFPGLMRSLDYKVLWVGPSYATPFASVPDSSGELMVSMGNMTAIEMAKIIRYETHLAKADVINLVVSPVHCTPLFYATAKQWTFPDRYYTWYGKYLYLADFSVDQLAVAYGLGAHERDYRGAAFRSTINRQYFWMPFDQNALTDYWTRYDQPSSTKQLLGQLRQNLPQAFAAADKVDLTETDKALEDLFRAIDGLPSHVTVNVIFSPVHLAYWAQDPTTIVQMLHVRAALHGYAVKRSNVRGFDFSSDWAAITDRTLYYDYGHFTDRDVAKMRTAIADHAESYGEMEPVLRKFLETPVDWDESVAASIRVKR